MLSVLASGLPHYLHWFEALYWPESSRWYAFTSSVGSTFAWPLWGFAGMGFAFRVYRKHFECHEDGCKRHGKYVIEGGVRCCDLHHPALDTRDEKDRGHVHNLHVAHLAHLDKLAEAG